MADANDLLRYIRENGASLRDAIDSGYPIDVPVSAKAMLNCFLQLDDLLSSGGTPPEAWSEGPPAFGHPQRSGWVDEHRPQPEGFGVWAHYSTSVPGAINIEMDVPEGQRVRIHFNEWLAVDSTAGVDHNDGVVLPPTPPPAAEHTATRISTLVDFQDGALYLLEPAWHDSRYVVVSATGDWAPAETLIFPAHPDGTLVSEREAAGFKGTRSHADALAAIGYTVAN